MAAPTNTALVKKVLANSELSTHDPKRTSAVQDCCRANWPLKPISPVANPWC